MSACSIIASDMAQLSKEIYRAVSTLPAKIADIEAFECSRADQV